MCNKRGSDESRFIMKNKKIRIMIIVINIDNNDKTTATANEKL